MNAELQILVDFLNHLKWNTNRSIRKHDDVISREIEKAEKAVLAKRIELAKELFPNEQLFFGWFPCFGESPIGLCIYRASTLTQRLSYEAGNFPCAICGTKSKNVTAYA